ncbi:MAG TPA: HAD-IA family hydrolase, partial [Verrucomicrobiae bacterium]
MPKPVSSSLKRRLARVKLFLCDVDGVLTDGSIFIGGDREFKRFNIRDGLGLVLARRAGLKIGWVSARPSPATKLRADELKIHFLVQQGDRTSKTGAIEELLAKEKMKWDEVCFVGDDIVDLGPLKRAGLAVAVADGVTEAKAAAHFTTHAFGGHGAVREVLEMILQAQ